MTATPVRTILLCAIPLLVIFAPGCFSPSSPAVTSPSRAPELSALQQQPTPLFLARTEEEARAYAGDQACAPCHSEIAEAHRTADHARSLHTVTASRFRSLFLQSGTVHDPFGDTDYRPAVLGDDCAIVSEGPAGKQVVRARFALGSMHNGQTYLGQDDARNWYVMQLSYYTHIHRWDFSPQQEPMRTAFLLPEGVRMRPKEVADCLTCHATTLLSSSEGIDVQRSRFGVGCESCHGPGVDHMAAIDRSVGKDPGNMEDLKKASTARVMQVCAGCHSTRLFSDAVKPEQGSALVRFAATALMQSKCYRSSDQLSCVTCHDPHKNASTETAAYEKVCLRCHGGSEAGSQSRTSAEKSHVCPVNPRSGCISCHMPTQEDPTFPNMVRHNHWIRVWRQMAKGQ